MSREKYTGKWERWIHPVSNGRWIVAEERNGYWWTRNTDPPTDGMSHGIRGQNVLDLVGKGAKTYSTTKAAIRALKKVYDLTDAG